MERTTSRYAPSCGLWAWARPWQPGSPGRNTGELMLQLLRCCPRGSGQPRASTVEEYTRLPSPARSRHLLPALLITPVSSIRRGFTALPSCSSIAAGTVRATVPPVGCPGPWGGGRGCWADDPWNRIMHGDAGLSGGDFSCAATAAALCGIAGQAYEPPSVHGQRVRIVQGEQQLQQG